MPTIPSEEPPRARLLVRADIPLLLTDPLSEGSLNFPLDFITDSWPLLSIMSPIVSLLLEPSEPRYEEGCGGIPVGDGDRDTSSSSEASDGYSNVSIMESLNWILS